ncbi:DgyrCDS161 [Dimorphilus gyrociliatus]|uniref:26S proteasome non-ATPase regulatory subunit 13 n=1 Tax=Dimorphilus gyrociliatus TaxID=2664684 RepID=A0A7I8V849_9ANNE|nr:DgyrCDS161 [Dimorphilus gyrociliatus]
MRDIATFLFEQQKKSSGEIAQEWGTLESLHNKKLWHQLTLQLQKFVKILTIHQSDALMPLYTNFIVDFEHRINPLALVEIAIPIARQIKDNLEAIEFLNKIKVKVSSDKQAMILCLTTSGQLYMLASDMEKANEIRIEAGAMVEELDGITPVHAPFYELSSNYHRIQADHANYYRDSLRFLGCIDLKSLSNEDQIERAFNIGLAAILGKGVYNFGELLQHDILEALKNSEKAWLVQLLFAFNSGDIKLYQQLKTSWSKQPDLCVNETYMRQKICLLTLMEMTFRRPATERSLTFAEIAKETNLSLNEVEHLIMKALSLNLVKGSIDQVEQVVRMTWVQPRVLDRDQIRSMAGRLQKWCDDVMSMEELVHNRALDILN